MENRYLERTEPPMLRARPIYSVSTSRICHVNTPKPECYFLLFSPKEPSGSSPRGEKLQWAGLESQQIYLALERCHGAAHHSQEDGHPQVVGFLMAEVCLTHLCISGGQPQV